MSVTVFRSGPDEGMESAMKMIQLQQEMKKAAMDEQLLGSKLQSEAQLRQVREVERQMGQAQLDEYTSSDAKSRRSRMGDAEIRGAEGRAGVAEGQALLMQEQLRPENLDMERQGKQLSLNSQQQQYDFNSQVNPLRVAGAKLQNEDMTKSLDERDKRFNFLLPTLQAELENKQNINKLAKVSLDTAVAEGKVHQSVAALKLPMVAQELGLHMSTQMEQLRALKQQNDYYIQEKKQHEEASRLQSLSRQVEMVKNLGEMTPQSKEAYRQAYPEMAPFIDDAVNPGGKNFDPKDNMAVNAIRVMNDKGAPEQLRADAAHVLAEVTLPSKEKKADPADLMNTLSGKPVAVKKTPQDVLADFSKAYAEYNRNKSSKPGVTPTTQPTQAAPTSQVAPARDIPGGRSNLEAIVGGQKSAQPKYAQRNEAGDLVIKTPEEKWDEGEDPKYRTPITNTASEFNVSDLLKRVDYGLKQIDPTVAGKKYNSNKNEKDVAEVFKNLPQDEEFKILPGKPVSNMTATTKNKDHRGSIVPINSMKRQNEDAKKIGTFIETNYKVEDPDASVAHVARNRTYLSSLMRTLTIPDKEERKTAFLDVYGKVAETKGITPTQANLIRGIKDELGW